MPWEEVRRGGKREGGERRGGWGGRGRRESWSGVKCGEDSDERQLSCTSAHPGAPVSRRTCKVCRSRPDNTPTFLHRHIDQHTHIYTHTSSQERADAPPLERHRLSDSMPVKLSLAPSHMRGKVRLMKKKTHGGSEEESLRHEQTTWSEQTLLKDLMLSKCWNEQYKKLHESKSRITRTPTPHWKLTWLLKSLDGSSYPKHLTPQRVKIISRNTFGMSVFY